MRRAKKKRSLRASTSFKSDHSCILKTQTVSHAWNSARFGLHNHNTALNPALKLLLLFLLIRITYLSLNLPECVPKVRSVSGRSSLPQGLKDEKKKLKKRKYWTTRTKRCYYVYQIYLSSVLNSIINLRDFIAVLNYVFFLVFYSY